MADWTDYALALIWLVAIFIVCSLIYVLLSRFLTPKIGPDKSKFVTRGIIIIVSVLMANAMLVNLFNVTLNVLLASIGVISIAVAFASQQIMQNAMAGMLISMDKRIKTNDWVEVGGTPNTTIAIVKDVQTLGTVFVDINGREFLVPNSFLLANKVVNYTHAGIIMVSLNLTLPINNDMDLVRRVIMEEAKADGRILPWSTEKNPDRKIIPVKIREYMEYKPELIMGKDPYKPTFLVTELSDDGYSIEIRMWSYNIPERDIIIGELYEKVLKHMMQDGVNLYGIKKMA
jgi:small-conductance mechanosensitive channel